MALLSVRDLRTWFHTGEGTVRAVDGVDLDVPRGKTLGLVGESGCGKSVTSLSIMRLVPDPPGRIVGGRIEFAGEDLLKLPEAEMRSMRGRRIAMIFQDPMTALNPFMRIGDQLTEMPRLHLGYSHAKAAAHASEMLSLVGIPDARTRLRGYPHELSGGMRQRVMIAMALSCRPELLIADEPTTALDVTIQAQILDLIRRLSEDTGTSVILITHDLGVVAGMAHDVVVMYAGKVFERARTEALFARPAHPYTVGLLRSIPGPSSRGQPLYQIPGLPPDLTREEPGCPFAPRCARVQPICRTETPQLVEVEADHHSWCHVATDVYAERSTGAPRPNGAYAR